MANLETDRDIRRIPSGVVAIVPNVHLDTAVERKVGKGIYQAMIQRLQNHPRLRMFLFECRSFVHRTYILLTNKSLHRVPIGPAYLEAPSGRVYENTRSRSCIQDIERISSTRSWATPLDWAAYRDSWEAGVEWALNTSGTTLDSERKALLGSKLLVPSAIDGV